MSEKHTPGRIYVGAQNDALYITAGRPPAMNNDYPVHDADRTLVAAMKGDNYEIDSANARRLVACWNACEGVPIEVLEAQKAGGLPWSVADQIEQRMQFDAYKEGSEEAFGAVVEQKRKAEESVSRMESTIQSQQGVIVKMRTQRDELLAALEEVLNLCAAGDVDENTEALGWGETIKSARAAIAKVKGGAA